MMKAPSRQMRGLLREVHDLGGSRDILGLRAVRVFGDGRRPAVGAIHGAAGDFGPFVKAFTLAHASETHASESGTQDQRDHHQEAAES